MLECDLQLPEVLPVETGRQVAGTQASANPMETTTPTLRHVAQRRGRGVVRPGESQRQALLLPGNEDRDTMAEHSMRQNTRPAGAWGAPGALRGARRVREAIRGNPPMATPAGRPGSTSRAPDGGERPSISSPSQRRGEAGGSLIRGSPGRAGAASTKSRRLGTAGWAGRGEQDGKVYERNRLRYASSRAASSNPADPGWFAVRTRLS